MQKAYFSRYKEPLMPLPDLLDMQLGAFQWLVHKGLQELFEDFFPVEDYSGDLRLEFVNFVVEDPKHDEYHAREHNLTYEAPLRLRSVSILPNIIFAVKNILVQRSCLLAAHG